MTRLEKIVLVTGIGMWLVVLLGCDLPTEYTINSPNCPWPPPSVLDGTVEAIPLGCPYENADGTITGGWWK